MATSLFPGMHTWAETGPCPTVYLFWGGGLGWKDAPSLPGDFAMGGPALPPGPWGGEQGTGAAVAVAAAQPVLLKQQQ